MANVFIDKYFLGALMRDSPGAGAPQEIFEPTRDWMLSTSPLHEYLTLTFHRLSPGLVGRISSATDVSFLLRKLGPHNLPGLSPPLTPLDRSTGWAAWEARTGSVCSVAFLFGGTTGKGC